MFEGTNRRWLGLKRCQPYIGQTICFTGSPRQVQENSQSGGLCQAAVAEKLLPLCMMGTRQ